MAALERAARGAERERLVLPSIIWPTSKLLPRVAGCSSALTVSLLALPARRSGAPTHGRLRRHFGHSYLLVSPRGRMTRAVRCCGSRLSERADKGAMTSNERFMATILRVLGNGDDTRPVHASFLRVNA